MKGGSIVLHELDNGIIQIYQIISIELGAVSEAGIIRLIGLSDNTSKISGKQIEFIIPSNIFFSMYKAKVIKIYDKSVTEL